MENLIPVLDPPEDGYRILDRGLGYHDRLEPALQSLIFLDILSIFIYSGGADAVELASGQHWLQHVAGIQCAVGLSGSDNGMELIDKEDDLPVGFLDFLQNRLETLLEFAAVFCAGDERTHIQGEDIFILQGFRYVPLDDPLGKPLDGGGFAYAGIADQNRIIFGFSGKDTDDVPDLAVPADDGVKLLFSRPAHQAGSVFCQRVIGILRRFGFHPFVASHLDQHSQKGVSCDAVLTEELLHVIIAVFNQPKHDMLNRDIIVPHPLHLGFGLHERAGEVLAGIKILGGTAHMGKSSQKLLRIFNKGIRNDADSLDQLPDQAVIHSDEPVQKMNAV